MEEKINLYQKLSLIQNEMKVPKNLYNSFGKFYFRNCETILETAKPICAKYKTTLIITDTIINVGDRYYVKSVASLHDWESDEVIEGQALARESEHKAGCETSQLTGACSSYARKYALNGLFNLDDVKDADTMDNSTNEQIPSQKKDEVSLEEMRSQLTTLYPIEQLDQILEHYGVNTLKELDDTLVIQYYKNKVK